MKGFDMKNQYLELICNAIDSMNTFKRPNIKEADSFLKNLIRASGHAVKDTDILEFLDIEDNSLYVTYSWSSRGCIQSETHTLPISFLSEEDPIYAAKCWGQQVLKEELLNKKHQKEKELKDIEQKLAALG